MRPVGRRRARRQESLSSRSGWTIAWHGGQVSSPHLRSGTGSTAAAQDNLAALRDLAARHH